jgi:hypothetical protein
MPAPPGKECISLHSPAHPVGFPPPFKEDDDWDPSDIEPGGQLGILLGIDLHDHPLTCHLPGCFLHRRCKINAMRSPGCPEFRQYLPPVTLYESVETPVRKRDRFRIQGGQCSMTAATFPGLSFARRGDPVGRAAGGAVDQV